MTAVGAPWDAIRSPDEGEAFQVWTQDGTILVAVVPSACEEARDTPEAKAAHARLLADAPALLKALDAHHQAARRNPHRVRHPVTGRCHYCDRLIKHLEHAPDCAWLATLDLLSKHSQPETQETPSHE